jgi:hypothetical protein
VFEADLFASFEARAMNLVNKLLADVENSSAVGLKDRAKQQGEVALEEAKVRFCARLYSVFVTLRNRSP